MKSSKTNSPLNPDRTRMHMAYPSGKTHLPVKGIVIAADVGGTKTNLSLYSIKNGNLTALKEQTYTTTDYGSFMDMATVFRGKRGFQIDSICLGVAGPVIDGKVHGTNFPWEIDSGKISEKLQIASVSIINDMEANAYGLSALSGEDFHLLQEGSDIPGNAAIISPGTGLGEAGLFWDGSRYHPFATEGGHCDFSPRNALDLAFWLYLHDEFDHISWERVVSGQGIYNIYKFLRGYRDKKEPQWLRDKIRKENPPVVITDAALRGKDSICTETLELFTKYLAIEASELVLKTKSVGGVYIGGGIVPKIIELIDTNVFLTHFIHVGRLNSLLEKIPVQAVLNDKTALLGAAHFAAMSF